MVAFFVFCFLFFFFVVVVSCALGGIDWLIDIDFLSLSEYACVGFGQNSWF